MTEKQPSKVTDDVAGSHAAAAEHCEDYCDDCGARLRRIGDEVTGFLGSHEPAECIARQRLELLRHIRDELRRLNIHAESLAVAAKVANAQNEDLRTFYGKVIEERRRARNALLRRAETDAIAKAARKMPTEADRKRTIRHASKIIADIDRAKKKRAKVRRR